MPYSQEKWFCPDCGDFSKDRNFTLKEDGFEAIPTCLHCGATCSDSANDPRAGEMQTLEKEVEDARKDYESLKDHLETLTKEYHEDWWDGVD